MTTDMKKIPTPAEYLYLVKNNDIAGAEAYLVEHFGVMGQEGFQEKAYTQFAEETINLVNEEAKAAVEAAKNAAESAKIATEEEVVTDESEVQEAKSDSEAAN